MATDYEKLWNKLKEQLKVASENNRMATTEKPKNAVYTEVLLHMELLEDGEKE